MSDVPVLTFTEENRYVSPCLNDPIKVKTITFCVTIVYPDGSEDRYEMGSNYDSAIEKYLVMVNAYRHSIQ